MATAPKLFYFSLVLIFENYFFAIDYIQALVDFLLSVTLLAEPFHQSNDFGQVHHIITHLSFTTFPLPHQPPLTDSTSRGILFTVVFATFVCMVTYLATFVNYFLNIFKQFFKLSNSQMGTCMFYDKLEQLARSQGITVSRALVEAGIDKSQGTRWKTTGTKPSPKMLHKLCDYFKIPLDYFDEPVTISGNTVNITGNSNNVITNSTVNVSAQSLSDSAHFILDLCSNDTLIELLNLATKLQPAQLETAVTMLKALYKG